MADPLSVAASIVAVITAAGAAAKAIDKARASFKYSATLLSLHPPTTARTSTKVLRNTLRALQDTIAVIKLLYHICNMTQLMVDRL